MTKRGENKTKKGIKNDIKKQERKTQYHKKVKEEKTLEKVK